MWQSGQQQGETPRCGVDAEGRLYPHLRTPPALVTTAGRLRAARLTDAAALLEVSVYEGVEATDEGMAVEQMQRILSDQADGWGLHWVIESPEGRGPFGTVGFYRGFVGAVGEIGYVLRPAARGRGLMSAAVVAATAYGLATLGLAAVVARTATGNGASQRVLERAGFVLVEGPQREADVLVWRRSA